MIGVGVGLLVVVLAGAGIWAGTKALKHFGKTGSSQSVSTETGEAFGEKINQVAKDIAGLAPAGNSLAVTIGGKTVPLVPSIMALGGSYGLVSDLGQGIPTLRFEQAVLPETQPKRSISILFSGGMQLNMPTLPQSVSGYVLYRPGQAIPVKVQMRWFGLGLDWKSLEASLAKAGFMRAGPQQGIVTFVGANGSVLVAARGGKPVDMILNYTSSEWGGLSSLLGKYYEAIAELSSGRKIPKPLGLWAWRKTIVVPRILSAGETEHGIVRTVSLSSWRFEGNVPDIATGEAVFWSPSNTLIQLRLLFPGSEMQTVMKFLSGYAGQDIKAGENRLDGDILLSIAYDGTAMEVVLTDIRAQEAATLNGLVLGDKTDITLIRKALSR
jgi:hypothetical protein